MTYKNFIRCFYRYVEQQQFETDVYIPKHVSENVTALAFMAGGLTPKNIQDGEGGTDLQGGQPSQEGPQAHAIQI